MAVYVDNNCLSWRGKLWCHLVADSLDELHGFAAALGLRRSWFQQKTRYPHYDVTVNVRRRALAMGALNGDKLIIVTKAKHLRLELIGVIAAHSTTAEGEVCQREEVVEAP